MDGIPDTSRRGEPATGLQHGQTQQPARPLGSDWPVVVTQIHCLTRIGQQAVEPGAVGLRHLFPEHSGSLVGRIGIRTGGVTTEDAG